MQPVFHQLEVVPVPDRRLQGIQILKKTEDDR